MLKGSFGLTAQFPINGSMVNQLGFDDSLDKDGKLVVPQILVGNAQVSVAEGLSDPKEVAIALQLMFGVNLKFTGYYKRGEKVMNPVTRRMQNTSVETPTLEKDGWMFFTTGGRVSGSVNLTPEMIAAVKEKAKK